MKVSNLLSQIARSFRGTFRLSRTIAPGLIALAGGIMFVGEAQALSSTTILSEDFEADGDDSWGGGSDIFGTYATTFNYSNSPHSGITNPGNRYGHLIANSLGTDSSNDAGPLVSAPVDLTLGHRKINFDGWLAGFNDSDYAVFFAHFFDAPGGNGSLLGSVTLADGSMTSAADGVVESVNPAGLLTPGDGMATSTNWKHYVTSNAIPSGAQSLTVIYVGDTSFSNGNDAYADNIHVSTVVPEPTSIVLLTVGALGLFSRNRRPDQRI